MLRTRRTLVLPLWVVLLATAATAAAPAPGSAQDHGALRARLQAHLDSMHAAGRFPGVTLGVALPDGQTLALAAGYADTVQRTPMTTDARMLAGSVGKTLVAAVALQLVAEARLDLDAPISRFFGNETWFDQLPNARDIRVRHLMNHTSGLVRYEFDPRVAEKLTREPDHVWTPVERLSYLFGTPAPFAAGQGYNYSDTNYIVVGMVIEQLTGATLYDEVKRRLLAPHGLAGIIPADRRDMPHVVQGYAGPQNPFGGRDAMLENGRMIINPQMEWAGGGFATTSGDLARWTRLLFNGTAVPPGVLPQMLDGGPRGSYGLGVMIRTTDLGTGLGHGGFFPGYTTETRYYPDADLAVSLQFNTSLTREIGRSPSAALDVIALIVKEHGR
jgi:D-alanyl-D-alanine carboxypeptidase